ncbi:MAG TPA: hypothetical protein VNA19_13370 [Pyrinomonadaceae bacterium]|jgi:hypothetical protein|nr:hypothetical protein [Pyrinomonadaceae bacterium]
MLTVRPEQLQVFQGVADDAFVERTVEYLRKNHADINVRLPSGEPTVGEIADEQLRQMVRGGVARARRYGIQWESNLTAFVVLMFTAAPNFDQHPLIQLVLNSPQTPPESKIDRLWEDTTEENWQAVEAAYDPAAWGWPAQEEGER